MIDCLQLKDANSTNNTIQGNIPKRNQKSYNQLLPVSVSYYDTTSDLQEIILVEVTISDGQLATVKYFCKKQ